MSRYKRKNQKIDNCINLYWRIPSSSKSYGYWFTVSSSLHTNIGGTDVFDRRRRISVVWCLILVCVESSRVESPLFIAYITSVYRTTLRMASQMDQTGKDDLKTQFATREGTYRLMNLSEYSRPNRVGYQTNQSNPQVRVSLVSLPAPGGITSSNQQQFAIPRNSSTTSSNASSSLSTFPSGGGGPGRGNGGGGGGGVDGASDGLMVISPSLINSMTNGGLALDNNLQQHQINNLLTSPIVANHSASHHHPAGTTTVRSASPTAGGIDRICFNFGKELYVYAYRGCKKVNSLTFRVYVYDVDIMIMFFPPDLVFVCCVDLGRS